MAGRRAKTPLRAALRVDSGMQALVHDGIAAMRKADRKRLADGILEVFADSLDLDGALKEDYPAP